MRCLLPALALLAAACGNPTLLDVKAYSQACSAPADCVPVKVGDVCAPCGCPNTAIAASDKARYDKDADIGRSFCGPVAAIACAPCRDAVLTCTNGACGLQ
jgi:hypothetical protein